MQKWQAVETHITIFSLKVDFTFIDRITTSWCFLTASCENSDVANRHIDSSARYLRLVSRFDRNWPNWLHARTSRFGSVSLWMIRLMASNSTAFFAFECWTFFDFGGSCALFRIVSKHSFNLPRTPGSSESGKQNDKLTLQFSGMLLLLLLFLWQMVEKLSYHCSGIPVEFDDVLEHLLVSIKFRAI